MINKLWYTHTKEYCLAIRRNEALIHATAQENLGNVTINQRNQAHEVVYVCIFVYMYDSI